MGCSVTSVFGILKLAKDPCTTRLTHLDACRFCERVCKVLMSIQRSHWPDVWLSFVDTDTLDGLCPGHDWLILALPEDPRKLRALCRRTGRREVVQKRRFLVLVWIQTEGCWVLTSLLARSKNAKVKVALQNSGILKKKALTRGLLCLASAKTLVSSAADGALAWSQGTLLKVCSGRD